MLSPPRIFALIVCLAAPPAAADIFIWTDERGVTVISDEPPANPRRVTNLERVVKEDKSKRSAAASREPTANEQRLIERVENLERQLRAQTYSAPPPPAPAPAPTYAVTYSTTPPPPPAYDPFQSPYFGPTVPFITVPGPIVVGRGFGHRRHFHHHRHGTFVHRGRR